MNFFAVAKCRSRRVLTNPPKGDIILKNCRGCAVKRTLDTASYLDAAAEMLADGTQNVPVPVTGGSMAPFLAEGDTVYLEPVGDGLCRGDIVLYRRENGRYVLHRLCGIRRDGSAVMLGDAQTEREVLPRSDMICGKVSFCIRRGKRISRTDTAWRMFSALWLAIVPLRPAAVRAVKLLKGRRSAKENESEK